MAKSTINLGTTPNDRTGDTLRDAGSKTNSNFSELYTALGNGTALNIAVTGATSGQVLKFNGTNFVPAADINTDAVTSVNTLTGAITLTSQNIAEPATNPVLAGVAIAGTAGQFTCTATTLAVGQTVTITGTLGGTGTITDYTTGKVYTISVTNGTTSFTLVDAGVAIVTTAGTPTGLTYTPSTLNLYFSNARSRAAISASGALAYNSTTGALTFTQGNTDTVAEGTTNQYYTAGRFDFRLSQTTTTSLTEGTNLYFTNARARSAISGTGAIGYDSSTGVISFGAAPAGTLTGATLASGVTASSLTSVGTIATGVWNGTAIVGQYGGTGVNNSGKTITLGGNLTTSGPYNVTLTLVDTTNVTLPITGTLATLAASETLTNKTLTSPVLGGTTISASGNIVVKPATNILEVQGDGTSVVGQLQLNCHVNSHGQKIASQPHSEAATNTLLLPGGTTIGNANAVLVSDTGIQTLSNKTAGVATATSTAASLGYLGIPQSATATTATLAIGDAGKHIYVTTNGQTITIPANATVAYPIGTTIDFIAGASATTVTIAIDTDTMYLAGTGTTGSRTLAAHGMATAVKVAATTWYISGYGLT
jgi:hypothetical protein